MKNGRRIQAARLQANTGARPQGLSRPSPEEAWQARSPIREESRAHFVQELEFCRLEVRKKAGAAGGEVVDAETASRWERFARAFAG